MITTSTWLKEKRKLEKEIIKQNISLKDVDDIACLVNKKDLQVDRYKYQKILKKHAAPGTHEEGVNDLKFKLGTLPDELSMLNPDLVEEVTGLTK